MLNHLGCWLERQWWQRATPLPGLQPLASIYQRISERHLQQRASKLQSCGLPLISIGNITVGGSGKTPFTLWLAARLQRAGWRPVLLCRGDGGKNTAPQWVTSSSLASNVGDEALMLHRLSGLPVMAAHNRLLAAQHIAASGKGNVILLDDGFQYRQLARQCDIVLIPEAGVGNGGLIPAGPLREPLSALDRAHMIVRSSQQPLPLRLRPVTQGKEWQWSALPAGLADWNGQRPPPAQGSKVQLIAAIARPERLRASLQQLGYIVEQGLLFRDHYRYQAADIARFASLRFPVTSAKDAVKLLPLWPANHPLWVVEQTATGEQGLFAAIQTFLSV